MFNYDIFTVTSRDGIVKRLTSTKSAEYEPVWSPDGTRIAFSGTTRELTSSETTMEDTHVWVMRADGVGRIEVGQSSTTARARRSGRPTAGSFTSPCRSAATSGWRPAGTARPAGGGRRGAGLVAYSLAAGDRADAGRQRPGSVGAFSVVKGRLAYAFAAPDSPAELFVMDPAASGDTASAAAAVDHAQQGAARRPSDRRRSRRSRFTNEGFTVEAFLTRPASRAPPRSRARCR